MIVSFKKMMKLYDKLNADIFYYINIIIGCLLLYCIYTSADFALSDMYAIAFSAILIYGAAIIKILGIEEITKKMNQYDSAVELFKSMWLYTLFWIVLSIMTLREIFFS